MPAPYTVSAAAAALSVSVSTVRRIADDFSGYLPDYQPLPGEARRLSAADVLTISAILTRLQARPGLTRSALLTELSAPGSEPLIIPASLPTGKPQDGPGRAITIESVKASQGSAETPSPALPALRSEIQSALATLSERVERIERRASQPATAPDRTLAAAAVIATGALIVGIAAAAIIPWPMAGVISSVGALLILVAALAFSALRR